MAKDAGTPRLDELSDREIERLEARLFCAGGPPKHVARREVGQPACAREAGRPTTPKG